MTTGAIDLGNGVHIEPQGWTARLGRRLAFEREQREVSLRQLAKESCGRFTARELRQFERGARPAGDTLSQLLADLYQVDLDDIAPSRNDLDVDLDTGAISSGGATRKLSGGTDTIHDTLTGYLDLVWALRGARGKIVSLREADVHTLADVLALDEDVVVDGLAELMQCSKADARRLLAVLRRRAVVVPVGAVLLLGVSTGLAGTMSGLLFAGSADAAKAPAFVQPLDDPRGAFDLSDAGSLVLGGAHDLAGGGNGHFGPAGTHHTDGAPLGGSSGEVDTASSEPSEPGTHTQGKEGAKPASADGDAPSTKADNGQPSDGGKGKDGSGSEHGTAGDVVSGGSNGGLSPAGEIDGSAGAVAAETPSAKQGGSSSNGDTAGDTEPADEDLVLTGTNKADVLTGGSGNDTIDGGKGNDTIDGGAGNDVIDGGAGKDTIKGGTGNDTIDGGAGNDVIDGGAGNDTIDGGAGNDTIDGGAGNDVIDGGAGKDTIKGGTGKDTIDGGAGNDTIDGGKGNDTIDGGAGNDVIDGGDGNDVIDGGDGNDLLLGGKGNDKITGGSGGATAYGGPGNDTYFTTDGAKDRFFGGSGKDKVVGNVEAWDEIDLDGPDGP